MSQAVLLLAVRDRLRLALAEAPWNLTHGSIEVRYDGQPPPGHGGETYVAIHPHGWRGEHGDYSLGEVYGCAVTVTRRIGYTPSDRDAIEVWAKETRGLEALLRVILLQVHKRYAVLQAAAETYLALTWPTEGGNFAEPLVFQDGGNPEPRGPDWFSADGPQGGGRWANAGVSQTLLFEGAKRYQGPVGDEEMT